MHRLRVRIGGVVQGVGFRPFVYRLALSHGVTGSIFNDGSGVTLEVQGPDVPHFLDALQQKLPPVARIDSLAYESVPVVQGEEQFRIVAEDSKLPDSGHLASGSALVTPDLLLCEECRAELYDPANRRYLYPFLNCTSCGPRFTIVRRVPYTRANTTLDQFPLCEDCAAEYANPRDRRFHAEPIACHICGPRIYLLTEMPGRDLKAFFRDQRATANRDVGTLQQSVSQVLNEAAQMLRAGRIVGIKGLGGWHLACDATNEAAVRLLRERKARDEKPFAVMFEDMDVLNQHADRVSPAEAMTLRGIQAPVVLLSGIPSSLASSIAPNGMFLGAMLPSTPLHDLLLHFVKRPLVMTSGNRSGDPTLFSDQDAFRDLHGIADAWLIHDREIVERCDDSVLRLDGERRIFYRRSRGYAPDILPVRGEFSRTVFASGAFLNNTFAFGAGRRMIPGHHIGDLDHPSTVEAFRNGLRHYERLFHLESELFVSDLHPDYPSTQIVADEAARRGIAHVQVQHHQAHVASCLLENGYSGPALGLALDGTGLGHDGTIWGGELFVVPGGPIPDASSWTRAGSLRQIPMPGGDAAVRDPWRMALSLLSLALDPDELLRMTRSQGVFSRVPASHIESTIRRLPREPLTSGCGRLFDAVSFLAGGPVRAGYEGQPAVFLESQLPPSWLEERPYEWSLQRGQDRWLLDPTPVARQLVADLANNRSGFPDASRIAMRFHRGLVDALLSLVDVVSRDTGILTVALSGGCLFNCYLSRELDSGLAARGLKVLHQKNVPPGDGGIAPGQLYLAGAFRADELEG